MYKYLALAIVSFCISYIGYMIKKSYKNKNDFLNELDLFINYLIVEIKNNKDSLIIIINRFIKSNNIGLNKFLLDYINILNSTFEEKEIYSIIPNNIFFTKNETEFVFELFNNLGKYDFENEIGNLNKQKNELQVYRDKAKDDLIKKGDLYFKLSLMLSLAIILIAI